MNTQTSADSAATTEQELAALGQNDFEAVLSEQQVEEYERTQNTHWGARRRMALVSLLRNKQQLVDGFGEGDGPDALLDMIEDISDWQNHLKSQLELAEMAVARLAVVSSAIIYRTANGA